MVGRCPIFQSSKYIYLKLRVGRSVSGISGGLLEYVWQGALGFLRDKLGKWETKNCQPFCSHSDGQRILLYEESCHPVRRTPLKGKWRYHFQWPVLIGLEVATIKLPEESPQRSKSYNVLELHKILCKRKANDHMMLKVGGSSQHSL